MIYCAGRYTAQDDTRLKAIYCSQWHAVQHEIPRRMIHCSGWYLDRSSTSCSRGILDEGGGGWDWIGGERWEPCGWGNSSVNYFSLPHAVLTPYSTGTSSDFYHVVSVLFRDSRLAILWRSWDYTGRCWVNLECQIRLNCIVKSITALKTFFFNVWRLFDRTDYLCKNCDVGVLAGTVVSFIDFF